MSAAPGLFALLLGAQFATLLPVVQRVHRGRTVMLHGSVDVTRGHSWMARLLCRLARLPAAQAGAPARVHIEVFDRHERWTRYFGTNAPMSSTLRTSRGRLVERMGPLALSFELRADHGVLKWALARATVCGLPVPRDWFRVSANVDERGGRYRFDVSVESPLVGPVIAYRGDLEESTGSS